MKYKRIDQSHINIKKRLGKMKPKTNITDARQRILEKKRKTVKDARDILLNKTRKFDARNKIEKIRNKNVNGSGNVRVIGSNILKKTDRNGRVSLTTTNKSKVIHDLNVAIQRQLVLNTLHPLPKKIIKRFPRSPPKPSVPMPSPVIRKTILNDYIAPIESPVPFQYEEPSVYRWHRPESLRRPESRPSFNVTRNLVSSQGREWRSFVPNARPTNYIDLDAADEDQEMPLMTRATTSGRTGVHSRLDSSSTQSHGILSMSKTKVVVPVGHRIVVSNLQSCVTEDDIRELFEDIGQLLVARLVRPGTAEVIYKNLKDAQKAVDTYHNRQLDGQPMKCLLVNKRPLNNPTAPAIHATTEGILSGSLRKPVSTSDKLVPDVSTIHKVLFQRN